LRCGRGASISWNDQRPAAARVDQVLGAVAAAPVAEHGTPERQQLGGDERVDRDLDVPLQRRSGDPNRQPISARGVPARQTPAEPA
jgi:hypothetical protein